MTLLEQKRQEKSRALAGGNHGGNGFAEPAKRVLGQKATNTIYYPKIAVSEFVGFTNFFWTGMGPG
jgi:hypothetical protein